MYEIRVLSNKEFDSLPVSETLGSDISDSLGFANRFTGKAYVRQTNIHELNKYLISHELEELESDESTHEDENGIRHKKFSQFLANFWNPKTLFDPGLQKETARKNAENDARVAGEQQQNALSQLFTAFAPQQQEAPQTAFAGQGGMNQSAFAPSEPPPISFSQPNPVESRTFGNVPSPVEPRIPSMSSLPNPIESPQLRQPGLPVEPPSLASGRVTGPLAGTGPQEPSSPRLPESSAGSFSSSIFGDQGNQFQNIGSINPELANRLKGFYEGRLQF